MAPILPERRRATASCGCAGRFAVPARAHCDDVRPSHRDVLNKKSARRGTDTKTVRVVTSTTPGAIVIICRASIQYGFLGKLRVCGIACISLHRAAAGMSCHRVLRMAGPRRRDRYRQRRPRNDFVPQRHRCLVGRIRLRHCHGHDAEAVTHSSARIDMNGSAPESANVVCRKESKMSLRMVACSRSVMNSAKCMPSRRKRCRACDSGARVVNRDRKCRKMFQA